MGWQKCTPDTLQLMLLLQTKVSVISFILFMFSVVDVDYWLLSIFKNVYHSFSIKVNRDAYGADVVCFK